MNTEPAHISQSKEEEVKVEEPPASNNTKGLPNIISPYLKKLVEEKGDDKGPPGIQFVAQPDIEDVFLGLTTHDPLIEEEHSPVPGLVYRYQGEVKNMGAPS